MLILATNLFRTPVIVAGAGKLGELGEPIINPENGQLLAFHILPDNFLSPKKIITLTDIIILDPKVVVIKNPECLIEPNEVVRIKKSLEDKITFLKTKCYTQNGAYLGKVEDAVIDNEACMIIKYYIKSMLQNRILPAERVVEIKKNKIIFDNSVIEPNIESGNAPA